MDDYRETIWGIRPKDRGWFQLLTLMGGTAGSVILTLLEFDSLSSGAPVSEAARNIALGIGASFVASGFISWGLMHAKEIPMLIADWIRDATERRRKRWREEGRQENEVALRETQEALRMSEEALRVSEEAREAAEEALREIRSQGYTDSQAGQSLDVNDADSTDGNDVNR